MLALASYPQPARTVSIRNIRRDLEFPSSTDTVAISATINSVDPITEASVLVAIDNGAFTPVSMTNTSASLWEATLGPYPTGTRIKYKVTASNGTQSCTLPFPLASLPFYYFHVNDNPISGSDVVLNEIIYNPVGGDNSSNSEFLEFYNRRSTPVDLSFFTVANTTDSPDDFFIPENTIVPANGFLIVPGNKSVFDSGYPALASNSNVVVVDSTGAFGLSNTGNSPNRCTQTR